MYIHPEVAPSCLLLMGITDPADGQCLEHHAAASA
jgi:5-keto 4-deoxyuronate isomerase